MPRRRNLFVFVLILVSSGLTYLALVLPLYARLSAPQFRTGEVAQQEEIAPRAITYVSTISTERQREAAVQAILPVYTSPDTSVARKQLERLRSTLAYITSVRADTFSSPEQKLTDLSALEDILLNQDTAQRILSLSDARWQAVQQEAIVVLEQVMRSTIREDRLEESRRSVPALVSLALPEDQAAVTAELAAGFVSPNSLFSQSLTDTARQQAREKIASVNRSYVAGELIIQRGQVITALNMEALEQFGLAQPAGQWQDLVSAAGLTMLVAFYFILYLRRNLSITHNGRGLALIFGLFLFFLVSARLILPGHTVLPYAFPLSAFGLVVASLFGAEIALIFSLPLAILFAYNLPSALDLTMFYLFSSVCGILTLGSARRMSSFFWAGVVIALSSTAVIVAFRLTQPTTDWIGLATLTGVSFLNGIASSSLTVLLQFLLAQFLGVTTALQLMEISRPDHALLQFILRNAPGTYQHSLQVANLAEQAAERIGADTLLTRVGALYHDAGKALNPYYFVENQVTGNLNLHDDLDPATSASTIIRHVADGLELAKRYRLPRRIKDFITEHHGTMITRYQYYRAVEAAGGIEEMVDPALFRYPGPIPQSCETAILMLADGSEASVRAERPKDEEALRALIKKVIENRLSTGQLDETDLTLRDLETIADSFAASLRGTYHPRIEYPQLERLTAHRIEASPTVPALTRQAADLTVESQVDSQRGL